MALQVAQTEPDAQSWHNKLDESIAMTAAAYNSDHHTALSAYPTANTMQNLFKDGLSIPVQEFLTYFLFHRVRARPSSYSKHTDVRRDIAVGCAYLTNFVRLNDGALYVESDVLNLPGNITEWLGESCALSLMNRLHGLIEADWAPIRAPYRQKCLDYEYASDGARIIQVEAKGAVVDTAKQKSSLVSNHALDLPRFRGQFPVFVS